MIKIIDYGMGNLRSVQKAFEKVGCEAEITSDKEEILKGDGVVLPGVGAFKDAMDNLKDLDLIDTIYEVVDGGTPFLGICLGLQLLFSQSDEFGTTKGLDIIAGRVERFPEGLDIKVPHIGWNSLDLQGGEKLYKGLEGELFQYFVHSYHIIPEDEKVIATKTDYGIEFVSSIAKDNIWAVQFHPEKSSKQGLKILENFGRIVESKG
ncbi:imidazole glycerol phosphate synthase subunit HisH [Halonatronum saccharophilum]|uniref:imidazole glycerol phosphate synthase subunit HisH n=1 Tax=Halonatronum saccharophilum TaxID=150060 RepID=UPI000488E208|nr:imidazole glycerol phosphate synthase subunit HisH [Halonatronum saccharophilum]